MLIIQGQYRGITKQNPKIASNNQFCEGLVLSLHKKVGGQGLGLSFNLHDINTIRSQMNRRKVSLP
jgi:hypothetical protein